MYEFLRTAGRCMKRHRFAAYVVGCIVFIAAIAIAFVFLDKHLPALMQYKEIEINLLNLIKIKALR